MNDKINFDPAICAIAAKMTEGFSFAYLKGLVMQALLAMARATMVNATKRKDGDSNFNAAGSLNYVNGQLQDDSKISNVPAASDHPEDGTLEPPIPEGLEANLFLQTLRAGVATLRKDIDGNGGSYNNSIRVQITKE
jgi:hypothetical protein